MGVKFEKFSTFNQRTNGVYFNSRLILRSKFAFISRAYDVGLFVCSAVFQDEQHTPIQYNNSTVPTKIVYEFRHCGLDDFDQNKLWDVTYYNPTTLPRHLKGNRENTCFRTSDLVLRNEHLSIELKTTTFILCFKRRIIWYTFVLRYSMNIKITNTVLKKKKNLNYEIWLSNR